MEGKRSHVRSKTPVTWFRETKIQYWSHYGWKTIETALHWSYQEPYTLINLNHGQRRKVVDLVDHELMFPPLQNQWACRDPFTSHQSPGWPHKWTGITSQWRGQGTSCRCTRRNRPQEECVPDPSYPYNRDNITQSLEHRKSICPSKVQIRNY